MTDPIQRVIDYELRERIRELEAQNHALIEQIGALKERERQAYERYQNRIMPCGCRNGWCDCNG